MEAHRAPHALPLALAPPEPHAILVHIERDVRLPPGVTGLGAFASVLRHLSRRLARAEARRLFEALPEDLRPAVEPCLEGRSELAERVDKHELLKGVARDLHMTNLAEVEVIARTVFHHVEDHLPASVFRHVMSQLPRELADAWAPPEPEATDTRG